MTTATRSSADAMPTISEILARKNAPSEPLLSYYKSAKSTEPDGSVTISAFFEAIRSDEYRETITRMRKLRDAGDEDGYAKAKSTLPAVSISGKTTSGRRAKSHEEGRFQHSGYLQIDIDAKDNIGWTVEEIRDILQAEPRVFNSFVTPSGDSVKGIARIRPDCATHYASFIAVRDYFAQHNIKIDEACKDPGRLCFVSWDPDAWIDLTRTAIFEPTEIREESNSHGTDIDDAGNPSSGLILKLRNAAFPTPPANGIHTWLMTAAWWCRIHDLTESDTVAKLVAFDGNLRRRFQPTEVVDAARKVFSVPRDASWKVESDMLARITPPSNSTATEYAPEDVFYDQPSCKYLIRVGNAYHQHGKKTPVITGLARYLSRDHDDPKELAQAVKATIADRELDGGVQWSGNIAGHPQGLSHDIDGRPMLVLSEAQQPSPAPGECPVITDLLTQAFDDPTAFEVFISWLAGRYRAVREHTHIPSPMLVMAGEVNSGKSLIAWIASQCLGGRIANPYSAWSGGILWNDDLIGAELLLVDDCSHSPDIRTRRNFGAAFKESMYPPIVQLRKRNVSSISVRPVWACIVCCNDTPEALQIIPPLDADMTDKVILLHVRPITLPIDTSSPEGRLAMQAAIRTELPAFVHQLTTWQTPPELHDTRSGVIAWRDTDLLDSVDAQSPARRLESLIEIAIENRGIWHDLPREFTAAEIEMRLTDPHSPVRDQARALFHWHGACGAALSRLAKMNRGTLELGTYNSDTKTNRYYVKG